MHDRLAITVMLYMFAVGFWGLFQYFRGGALTGSVSGALAIGQVLVLSQSLFGVILLTGGLRAVTTVHYLYGATAILVLPFVWSYMRARNPRQALLFYSLVAVFIGGLAIRGMTTGS